MAPTAAPIWTASPYINTRMYCSRLSLLKGGMTVFCRITACQNTRSVFSMGTCTDSSNLPPVMAWIRGCAFFLAIRRGRERVTRMLRTGFSKKLGEGPSRLTGTFSRVSLSLGAPGLPRTASKVMGSSSRFSPKGMA